MVTIEKRGGQWIVSSACDTKAEAFAKAARIEEVEPEAFKPSAPQIAHTDGHSTDGAGIIPHNIAEAMLRDKSEQDDEGDPAEPPRCEACDD